MYFKNFDIHEFNILNEFYVQDPELINLITNTEFKKFSNQRTLTVSEVTELMLNNNKYIRDKLRENDPAFVMPAKLPMEDKVAEVVEEPP